MNNEIIKRVAPFLFLAACGVVNAQTCSATAGNVTLGGWSTGLLLPVNTCAATDQLVVACSGLSPIGSAPDMIWQVTLGPGASNGNITVTPTGAAWNPYLVLMSGACSGGSLCVVDADNSGSGGAESGFIPSAAGTYWLMITDESGVTTCGTANVQLGSLPVSLQSFSVE